MAVRITTKEAAQRFDLSVETIRRWVREGRITGERKPGPGLQSRIMVDPAEIAAMLGRD